MRKLVQVFPADMRVKPATKFFGEAFIEIAADLVNRKIWAGCEIALHLTTRLHSTCLEHQLHRI
jgi:hypothetical protein